MPVWIAPWMLLGARLLWQRMPGLVTCALFWAIAAAILLLGWPVGPSQFAFGGGILCNASVTLANGGFMPVSARWRQKGPARSLWVQGRAGSDFCSSPTTLETGSSGSAGDVLLLIGLILSFRGL